MSTKLEIADVVEPTHDEVNRQKFVSILRKHVLIDFAGDMRTAYDERVKPRFVEENGREPKDGVEIRKEMRSPNAERSGFVPGFRFPASLPFPFALESPASRAVPPRFRRPLSAGRSREAGDPWRQRQRPR